MSEQLSVRLIARPEYALKFDYDAVSPSVAKFLKAQADRIRRYAGTSIIRIGKALIEAKRCLPHGAFLRWVEGEVGMRARTAQAYMQVAEWAASKSATVAHLPPSVLYALSAPSAPTEFIVGVLKRAEAGERIDLATIRKGLRDLRIPKRKQSDTTVGAAHQNNGKENMMVGDDEMAAAAVLEAVAIIASRLSDSEFNRVKEIMTNPTVLNDPELPRNMLMSFRKVEEPPPSFADLTGSGVPPRSGLVADSLPAPP